MDKKSDGQRLVETITAWLESYLVFPNEHYAITAALWALNTWFFEVFDATPYLAVTAPTKRAGKSTCLDLLSFISRNPEKIGAGTVAAMYRQMEAYDGRCSLFADEAERMSSSAAGMMRTFMNFGYRRGESIPRTMPGGGVQKFPCYCPKLFALIGDPTDTLRDRCILFVMRRAVGPKPYRPTTASNESMAIVREIRGYLASGALATLPIVAPSWLENRDQEIWEPLWSVVLAMGCDKGFIERFQRASAFLVAGKGAEIKRFVEHEDKASEERAAEAESYGEKAIRDLVSVLKADEKAIFSSTAVQRLRAIPTAPWANYRGEGLTENKLADLLSPFGVKPGNVRENPKRRQEQAKGYTRVNLLASLPVSLKGGE